MIVTRRSGKVAKIRLEVDGDDALAYDGPTQVGEVRTTGEVDFGKGHIAPPTITYMHVDEDYRRNGIGLALISELAEVYGTLLPASRNIGIGGQNALTDEGEALTRRAQVEGLIAPFPEETSECDDQDY